MTYPADFPDQTRDALAHFYDPVYLQTHPLADVLLADGAAGEKVSGLRELLLNAVEKLRPPTTIPFSRPEWLGYRVLREHYIEARDVADICAEIRLSRASVYSYQKRALEAMSDILWTSRLQGMEKDTPSGGPATDDAEESSAQREAERIARQAPVRPVNLLDLLHNVQRTFRPLAQQEGVALSVVGEDLSAYVHGDPAMLRQMILSVLIDLLPLVATGRIACHISQIADDTVLQLLVPQVEQRAAERVSEEGFGIGRGVSRIYGGQFRVERDGAGALCVSLALPTARPATLLIVDDDAETVRLYGRYLSGLDYALRQACTTEEMEAFLADNKPKLIILDVLMPGEDGWDILQRLKGHPQWSAIPVMICSVLQQPRLALALGAAAVLQKPVAAQELTRALRELLLE